MLNVHSLAAEINPSAIYSYFDHVQIWLKTPIHREEVIWFRSQCGSLHIHWGLALFGGGYRQRLQLKQPSRAALEKLLNYDDPLVNRIEVSLDWTFDQEDALENANEFVCACLVKKYHRRKHGIHFYKGTRYTGPWYVPTKVVTYGDNSCRISGAKYCFHFDYRLSNQDAVRRNGINCVADLLTLDHRSFWKERLLFRAVDLPQLGKLHRTRYDGKARRGESIIPLTDRFRYAIDRRRGGIIMRALGATQKLIDEYRPRLAVDRCLRDIDVTPLLPRPQGIYD
jgi:hypothetical protein